MLIKPSMADVLRYNWGGKDAPRYDGLMMARQYFNASLADSIIVESSVTPTTVPTSFFTPYTLCNLAFPLPYGVNAPFAGQVFRFAMGGIITTPATGTLVITPYMGQGASATSFTGAVSLGASPAQTVTASLSGVGWFLEGNIVFRAISSAATSSSAWLSGHFFSQGTLATAGGGWNIPFGSTALVSVDTTGTVANSYGCLTFVMTFSITGGVMKTEWTTMQSLN